MKYFVFLALILCVVCCDGIAESSVDGAAFSCTPSERFQKECNSCECSESGTWAQCDVYLCDPEDKTKKLKEPKDCKDKDRFDDGCNSCFCTGGRFRCTLRDCFEIIGNKETKADKIAN